ncbi:MAG: lysine--tRNA ligase [Pseudomonadota bacterium]
MLDNESEAIRKSREKAEQLAAGGTPLYPNTFSVKHTLSELIDFTRDPECSEESSPVFVVAGRIISIRRFGKASFFHVLDRSEKLQAYIQEATSGKESYALWKKLDIGDYVGLEGKIFKTKTGEWTLSVQSISLIAKAIRPLPEKFHGLKDPEKRYRQRYLDLISNQNVRDIFLKRGKIVQAFREFLAKRDFCEVETPMLQPMPGGAEAKPFKTFHNSLGIDMFLRIAPELYLKRLIIGGLNRVFEINRNFRNEGVSTQHNPEFTMLEFYQAYATYEDLIALTEEMFAYIAQEVMGTTSITYQGESINLAPPWQRMTFNDAMVSFGGVPAQAIGDKDALLNFAQQRGIQIQKSNRAGKILAKLFDALVEPHLVQPTFITAYPIDISPLSRRNDADPNIADRFELFIAGREIANGFSELNDPIDQKGRFMQQAADRDAGDDEAHCMDLDYIRALEFGMPHTAGEGIGIDRVVMLFTDSPSIREVILFPHMKPSEKG